jgi:hypothetical protein
MSMTLHAALLTTTLPLSSQHHLVELQNNELFQFDLELEASFMLDFVEKAELIWSYEPVLVTRMVWTNDELGETVRSFYTGHLTQNSHQEGVL